MRRMRVLVTDDNSDIRDLLRAVCEMEGYEVATAPDGVVALELLLQADGPWLVLLDIMMPRMTGLEVCSRLWAAPDLAPRHRVVLMTAGCAPEGDLPPPAQAMLCKPFDLSALVDLLAELAKTTAIEPEFGTTFAPVTGGSKHAQVPWAA
jgi:two-component system response regulator MprA